MLRAHGVPFELERLTSLDLRKELQLALDAMPESRTHVTPSDALNGVVLADTLTLPARTELAGDTVILTRNLQTETNEALIVGPHDLYLFVVGTPTASAKGVTLPGSPRPTLRIDVSGKTRTGLAPLAAPPPSTQKEEDTADGRGLGGPSADTDDDASESMSSPMLQYGAPGSNGQAGSAGSAGSDGGAGTDGNTGSSGSCPNPNGGRGDDGGVGEIGTDGGRGGDGGAGNSAGSVYLIITSEWWVSVDVTGGEGGDGGAGGKGGNGGKGGKGGKGGGGADCECHQGGSGNGGDGGNGGESGIPANGGDGGDGGAGGDGGYVEIEVYGGPGSTQIDLYLSGGQGGRGGAGGQRGNLPNPAAAGGEGGDPGGNSLCPSTQGGTGGTGAEGLQGSYGVNGQSGWNGMNGQNGYAVIYWWG